MLVTVCERLEDVREDLDAAHGRLVVSLSPEDAGRRDLGYAAALVAPPRGAARYDGVAVVAPGGWAPDPIRIFVLEDDSPPVEAVGTVAVVERRVLPALFHVDQVGRRVRFLRPVVGHPLLAAADDARPSEDERAAGEE